MGEGGTKRRLNAEEVLRDFFASEEIRGDDELLSENDEDELFEEDLDLLAAAGNYSAMLSRVNHRDNDPTDWGEA